ncbi:basic amino acid ABC transporter substrate-binding protein [Butyrivibrio sp. FCS014]|uniref:basic amino acid ABC transporter substrate-binding protein n=1 Tax=Butyrivibrio sp. FCS014 TaxID=1408304 RepID=UPI0004645B47|nr:basic amino acid ABC transporter substrate-binding protein [Butyrivibrio sp. FCS014]
MKKKLMAVIMSVIMTGSMLAGCGSAAGGAAEGGAKETLTVGTNAAFPPFEYVGDDGKPDGFDMALIKAVGDKIGMEVQIQDMEFDSLVSSIGGKIDVAIAGMTVTEERQKTVDFSDSYYEAVQAVIVPKGSSVASADDLKNLKIGVQLGTTGEFIADEIEGVEVSAYNKAVDAVNDLINGRVDCVIVDKNPAEVFGAQFSDKVDVLSGTDFDFEPEFYAIALPKGNTELADKINGALKELKEDGTYDKLVKQYIEE